MPTETTTTTTPTAPSFPEWQHRVDIIVPASERGPFRVTAGLHFLPGNRAPYFSVTAESVRREPGGEWRTYDGPGSWGGAAHDIILRELPQLAPVVALHLADHNGEPMHAIENGTYWLLGYAGGLGARYHGGNGMLARSADECLAFFASHFRIRIEEAREVADELLYLSALDAAQRDHMVRPGVIDPLACQRDALGLRLRSWYGGQKARLAEQARCAIERLRTLAAENARA